MNIFSLKNALLASLLLTTIGCTDEQPQAMTFLVKKQDFSVVIPASVELFAAKATIINAPMSSNGPQNIGWLAPEYSMVKQGDVIAIFDGEAMTVKSRNKRVELAMVNQDIIEKSGALTQELGAIKQDIDIVGQEKYFADKFAIDDNRILSKLKILESAQSSEYLGSKLEYFNWKEDIFSQSSSGQMGLLEMQQQQYQNKIDQLDTSLSKLEITAPHAGLLVYKANWRGEKPREGQVLWPGQKLAELPDVSVMKAKLFVAESEAIGLEIGRKVKFTLNALVDVEYHGSVESVAPFSKSIKRGDPRKYFELVVSLDKQNGKVFLPGRKLIAKIAISTAQSKLIVPLQSVFTKDNSPYVYLYQDGEFSAAAVTLGAVSLSHVEIVSGLIDGQKIALIDVEGPK